MRQALRHRLFAPGEVFGFRRALLALVALGNLQQALGRIAAAVEDHILHALAQVRLQLIVDRHGTGVDDAHVHAGGNRVVQEHRVDGLAHRFVAAEREGHVGDAAGDMAVRQRLLDDAGGLDEVHRVVVVLFDAGGDGEDVRVEDDVLRREADLVDQDAVGAGADLDLARAGIGLAAFVEGHHHCGGAVAKHLAHFSPASITLHLDESTITGIRAMSGSDMLRLR
ncbi:hypothetical protein G6F68_013936 [Rhizopus microsporus]|nr:hypothetical protein G6F68_013936 [Rhizopus microsporus]